ncbi:Conserved putative membrane protein [Waddlia chondrophila 2032/99]|uniref:Conserved putative membrane protein n=2 Tax=Waddlia chondrophila TaxID=71667 RepID=D6YTP4_WADCW|nr:DMT family transporter [Waddlia chondrophila]ADI37505.1 conserved putative membrane protein [Waddlia chondrophila WSU 86-1044]CCB90479.1 Conserved putative membrane protein [Waddlia chondrophila 2032/99]
MHLVVLLYAFFASVFTISKVGLQYTQPLFLVGTRMVFAGVLLLFYLFIFHRRQFSFSKSALWGLLQLAVFNIYLTNVFEFWGLQYLTSFKTCFIYSLSPFFSALISYFSLNESLSPKKWLGLAVGFIGFFPILLTESVAEEGVRHLFFVSWAELAVMLAAVTSVYGWIILRRLVKDEGVSPMMANGTSMVIGGAMALANSYLIEDWAPFPVTDMVSFAECMILLVVVSNMVCYNLYGYLLKRFTATFMSFAGFTTPLFTAIYGWFFLSEVISSAFYLSAAIVFIGLFLFYQEELKQGYTIPEPV